MLPAFVLKPIIENAGSELLKTPVTVETAKLSISSGDLIIQGLKVANPKPFTAGDAVHIGKFNVRLDIMSLFSDKIHVNNIEFTDSSILFETTAQTNNFATLANNLKGEGSTATTQEAQPSADNSASNKKIVIDFLKIAGIKVKASISGIAGQDLGTEMTIPTIEMTDIGKENDTTIKQALQIVSSNVKGYMGSDISGQFKRLLHNSKDQIKDLGKNLGENIGGSVDKLKGLLGN